MLLLAFLALVTFAESQQAAPAARVLATVPEGCEVKPETLRFSPNGAQVAYAVKKGKAEHPVTGEVVGDAFDEVLAPTLSPAGEHVAFRVVDYPKRDEPRFTLLFDGKKIATDAWIGRVALAPADSTPAFWQAGSWRNQALGVRVPTGCTLMFGKKKVSKWEKAETGDAPVFSDDGRFLYALGSRQDDWEIVVYDLKGKDSVMSGFFPVEVRVKPGGGELLVTKQTSFYRREWQPATLAISRIPTSTKRGNEGVITMGASYQTAGGPVYSPDGKHVAYRACQDKKFGVAIDDTKIECVHGYVDELVFDPRSTRVAYVASDEYVVERVDGAQATDGAVLVTDGKWFVVWGDQKSAEFERATLVRWSPDGSHIAFAGKRDGKWQVHVGDKQSEAFDEIAALTWSLDGKVVWCGARRDRELVWAPFAVE